MIQIAKLWKLFGLNQAGWSTTSKGGWEVDADDEL